MAINNWYYHAKTHIQKQRKLLTGFKEGYLKLLAWFIEVHLKQKKLLTRSIEVHLKIRETIGLFYWSSFENKENY